MVALASDAFATEAGAQTPALRQILPAVDFKQAVEKILPHVASSAAIDREYVAANYDAAFRLANEASRNHNPFAAYWLGRLYAEGKGVEQDVSKGIALLTAADQAGIGYASLSLWRIYSQGQLVERKNDLATAYHSRWVAYEIAFAEQRIEDTPMWKAIMNLDLAITIRYWKQRLVFFRKLSVYAEKERIRRQVVDPVSLGEATKLASLPAKCRPAGPPGLAMTRAKILELSGDILMFVGETLKPDGVLVGNISDPRMTIAAMRSFDVAFQNPECRFAEELAHRMVQVPFLFKLE